MIEVILISFDGMSLSHWLHHYKKGGRVPFADDSLYHLGRFVWKMKQ